MLVLLWMCMKFLIMPRAIHLIHIEIRLRADPQQLEV